METVIEDATLTYTLWQPVLKKKFWMFYVISGGLKWQTSMLLLLKFLNMNIPKKMDVTGAASVTDVCSQETKEKHLI